MEDARTHRQAGSPETHLELEKLSKRFGPTEVIPALDLSVRRGEMIALLGPSGCGKTTTLRMIAGLIAPTSGRIRVAGRDITDLATHDRDMGLVFQSYALFPHMSVAGNVAFGLEMRRMAKSEIRTRVQQALDLVQLGHLTSRRPRELSGGQQQRVALARALVIEPAILLLDEPLSNLDAKLRDEMRVQIRELQQASGITTVFVTHDQVEALSMCDRIVVMRGGHVEQFGSPHEVYEHPASPFVASFVGRTNRLEGQSDSQGRITVSGQQIRHLGAALPAGEVEILVRPHRLALSAPGAAEGGERNCLTGRLLRYTFVGEVLQSHVSVGDSKVIVEEATRRERPDRPVGASVALTWEFADTMVFLAGRGT